MGSGPQTEDGFTRIANELLEAILLHPFSKREHVVVLAIIRKTYGFGKKTDRIALSQLVDMTGIDKSNISKTLSDLHKKGVLLKQPRGNAFHIGISKNYSKWKVSAQGLSKQPRVVKTTTKRWSKQPCRVVKTTTTKETTTKEKRKEQGENDSPVDNLNTLAWMEYTEYRKRSKLRTLKPMSVRKQQEWLAKQGGLETQRGIIDETIRQGWQGLFNKATGESANGNQRQGNRAERSHAQLQRIANGD